MINIVSSSTSIQTNGAGGKGHDLSVGQMGVLYDSLHCALGSLLCTVFYEVITIHDILCTVNYTLCGTNGSIVWKFAVYSEQCELSYNASICSTLRSCIHTELHSDSEHYTVYFIRCTIH